MRFLKAESEQWASLRGYYINQQSLSALYWYISVTAATQHMKRHLLAAQLVYSICADIISPGIIQSIVYFFYFLYLSVLISVIVLL